MELELRTGARLTVGVSKVPPRASSGMGAVVRAPALSGPIGPGKVLTANGIRRDKGPRQRGPDRDR